MNPLFYSFIHTLFPYIQTNIIFPLVTTGITEPRLALRWISSVNYSTCVLFLRSKLVAQWSKLVMLPLAEP